MPIFVTLTKKLNFSSEPAWVAATSMLGWLVVSVSGVWVAGGPHTLVTLYRSLVTQTGHNK